MPRIPNDRNPDNTLALLLEGYNFISDRCRRFGSDLFETRLLLEKTICMRGAEAARAFYDNERFQRQGAAPARLRKTLFGSSGVQGLDGEEHRRRKGLFMSLMTPEAARGLIDRFSECWLEDIAEWEKHRELVLFDHIRRILCRAVCAWSGVPLAREDVEARSDEFEAMMVQGKGGENHIARDRTVGRRTLITSTAATRDRAGCRPVPGGWQRRWVLLDLYGTNHDPRIWSDPQKFRPERFRLWDGSPWNFIPQGGGDHYEQHRCAGEWITIELMKVAIKHLCRSLTYEVPQQSLHMRFSRIPAIPESRFVITNVKRCPAPEP